MAKLKVQKIGVTGKETTAIEDQRKPKIQTCRNTNMKGNQE